MTPRTLMLLLLLLLRLLPLLRGSAPRPAPPRAPRHSDGTFTSELSRLRESARLQQLFQGLSEKRPAPPRAPRHSDGTFTSELSRLRESARLQQLFQDLSEKRSEQHTETSTSRPKTAERPVCLLWSSSLPCRPGRLADPTQRTDCGHPSGDHLCISVDSWWADLNFYLSAMPFLAAVDSGMMGIPSDNVTLLPPYKEQMSFCFNVSSCHSSFPEAMKKWNEFYQHLKSNSSSFDDLLKYLWAAHVSSLEVAHKNFHNRTYKFQEILPTRVLLSGDRPLFISDFTGFQKSVLLTLNLLHIVHKYTGTLSFIVWKALMKSEIARELSLEILEFILHYFN